MGAAGSVERSSEYHALAAVERAVSINKETALSPARGSWRKGGASRKYLGGADASSMTYRR